MTTDQTTTGTLDNETIEKSLLNFITASIKTEVAPDTDLFGSGLVSSMFAMQLVVHLEEAFDVAIVGSELKLDNFRTVQVMTELVQRLREESAGDE
jgi:methoxymalonate biosynthesis acyl carrier protein